MQKINVVKDCIGSDSTNDLVSVDLRDENGNTVKISLIDCPPETKASFDNNDIDEIIFIMDSYIVTDRGYHEIAQRFPSLPRSCQILKRRQELNATFEIKILIMESMKVYSDH